MSNSDFDRCLCGHNRDEHVTDKGACLHRVSIGLCNCDIFKGYDKKQSVKKPNKDKKSILTFCKGTSDKHRLVYYHSEANSTSGILTIWYLCVSCNHCIVRHYNPQNSNCSIVTDEQIGLDDDKGNSI